jgi:hypothetical protein
VYAVSAVCGTYAVIMPNHNTNLQDCYDHMRSELVVLRTDVIICNQVHLEEENTLRVSIQFAASSTIAAADGAAIRRAIEQGAQRSVAIRARALELAQAGALRQALVSRGFAPLVALSVPQRSPCVTFFRKLAISELKLLTSGLEVSKTKQRASGDVSVLKRAQRIETSLHLYGVSVR